MSVKKAVILAAGFGTRMLPFTKSVPKELLPIGNVPAIQCVIDECVSSGITDICIVTNAKKSALMEYTEPNAVSKKIGAECDTIEEFKSAENSLNKVNITYVLQGKLRGTAKAVEKCENFVGSDPFCVVFPDEIIISEKPCLKQLIEAYDNTLRSIVGVCKVKTEDCARYGVIKYRQSKGRYFELENIIEKPKSDYPSNLISCGRFVFNSDIFHYIKSVMSVDNEYYLPSAVTDMAKDTVVFAYEIDGKRYDLGNKNDYVKAVIDFALADGNKVIKEYLREIIK